MLRVLLIVVAALQLSAADFSGRWTGILETPAGPVRVSLSLQHNQQELAGSVMIGNDPQPVSIEASTINGDVATFRIHDRENRVVEFQIALRDGRISGEASMGGRLVLNRTAATTYRTVSGVSSPAMLIHRVEPHYTPEAREAKVEGTVVLEVQIETNGRVGSQIRVAKSLGEQLDEKAIEAVKQWRYKPAYRNGTPVTFPAKIELNFRL